MANALPIREVIPQKNSPELDSERELEKLLRTVSQETSTAPSTTGQTTAALVRNNTIKPTFTEGLPRYSLALEAPLKQSSAQQIPVPPPIPANIFEIPEVLSDVFGERELEQLLNIQRAIIKSRVKKVRESVRLAGGISENFGKQGRPTFVQQTLSEKELERLLLLNQNILQAHSVMANETVEVTEDSDAGQQQNPQKSQNLQNSQNSQNSNNMVQTRGRSVSSSRRRHSTFTEKELNNLLQLQQNIIEQVQGSKPKETEQPVALKSDKISAANTSNNSQSKPAIKPLSTFDEDELEKLLSMQQGILEAHAQDLSREKTETITKDAPALVKEVPTGPPSPPVVSSAQFSQAPPTIPGVGKPSVAQKRANYQGSTNLRAKGLVQTQPLGPQNSSQNQKRQLPHLKSPLTPQRMLRAVTEKGPTTDHSKSQSNSQPENQSDILPVGRTALSNISNTASRPGLANSVNTASRPKISNDPSDLKHSPIRWNSTGALTTSYRTRSNSSPAKITLAQIPSTQTSQNGNMVNPLQIQAQQNSLDMLIESASKWDDILGGIAF